MKIAVISDIHSNPFALEAVLKDIEKQDIDQVICTGDLIGYMPMPNEVVEMIKSRNIQCIKGNHDLKVLNEEKLDDHDFESLEVQVVQQSASKVYTRYILKEENYTYLNNLPESIRVKAFEYDILFVHGSPRKIDEYMYEDGDNLLDIEDTIQADVVVSGHTHIPYCKKVNDTYFINAGSVGKPKHGNSNACYIILDIRNEFNFEIHQVVYDFNKIKSAILNCPYVPDKIVDDLSID
jgi:putative phosphoesterase